MRNKHRGFMWKEQEGCCYFCREPMEKWPYPIVNGHKLPRANQAVKAHINTRLTGERADNPTTVLAHNRCAHGRARDQMTGELEHRHRLKTWIGRDPRLTS